MSIPINLKMALLSAAVLGLRHGFDYDHIAAISDITSVQNRPARALRLGFLYALGHGCTVAVLGSAVIFFQLSLPKAIDQWAERLVGITLVVLAIYVVGGLFRKHPSAPKSRIAHLITGSRWLVWKFQGLFTSFPLPKPSSFSWNYDSKSVFAVGMIHGLGAETPSQLVLFLLAANLGGTAKGFLGLVMFLCGLLLMNTLMTLSATGIFRASTSRPGLLRAVTGLTAVYSFFIGMVFLLGSSGILPPIGEEAHGAGVQVQGSAGK